MKIDLQPGIEALLREQVGAGAFASIEAALAAAVAATFAPDIAVSGDLSWAKPYLDEAEQAIADGRTASEAQAFAGLEQRYGKL